MASVSPQPSPNSSSPYDFDSAAESEEHWQWIDYGAGSTPSSIFLSDPASGSLNSFAIVGHVTGNTPSPAAASPLMLGEMGQAGAFFPTSFPGQPDQTSTDVFSTTAADGSFVHTPAGFMTPQQYLFQQDATQLSPQSPGQLSPLPQDPSQLSPLPQDPSQFSPQRQFSPQELNDMAPFMGTFTTDIFPGTQVEQPQQQQHMSPIQFNIRQPMQSDPNVPPWNPTNPRGQETVFAMEDYKAFTTPSPKSMYSGSISSPGSRAGSSSSKSPPQIRKTKVGRVEKKTDQHGQFVIVTPTSIHAHSDRPNPYECFDVMRTSQRGRKGPLANATKENALQVRRLGACFCCHSRKVKCDKERPCKSCKKLMIAVPQVVCWQFQDFLPVLFPDFIRGHFRKDEMTKFVTENIDGFTVNGRAQNCSVELFSGPLFSTVLAIDAKFFTAKTCDVLQHWHMKHGTNLISLHANGSAPIGLDFDTATERDAIKKKAKKYVQDILAEPAFVDQVTDSIYSAELPKKILRVVKQFADATDSVMVKRALSIYCMHYIMTRHLCLTQQTIDSLGPTGLVPQNDNRVTPRVLARQVKSIIDEMMMREMQQLFELFSKSLKPKSRREWAPCLASFLTLCLFMEAVETAADVFVVTQNEISMRNSSKPQYQRSIALNTVKAVEHMPFGQFAYQFHQVYQTHSKEANAKSFNPLFDPSFAEQQEIDSSAVLLAAQLKEMFFGDTWQEIGYLVEQDILPPDEPHPYPRDPQALYTGRLVAKFLMSFIDDKVIFGSSN